MPDQNDDDGDDFDWSPVYKVEKDAAQVGAPKPPVAAPAERPAPRQTSPVIPDPLFIEYPVNAPGALEWASQRLDGIGFRADAKSISRVVNGRITGVIVFDTFSGPKPEQPNDCMVHIASDGSRRWMSRKFIVMAMSYPFLQLKFPRITCEISEKNEESINLAKAFGWTVEGRRRAAAYDGSNTYIFGMLMRECHWLFGGTRKLSSTGL